MRYLATFLFACLTSLSYSQELRYDSLQNINQSNYTQLVGQTLFYPAGEIVVSNLFWSNKKGRIYKSRDVIAGLTISDFTLNEAVLNKHFVVEKIISGSQPLLKTKIKENNDVVYINLNALFRNTAVPMLFVDGYIQKCKELFLNKVLYINKAKYYKKLPSEFDTKVPALASIYCNNIRVTTLEKRGGALLLSARTTSNTPTEIDVLDYLNAQISKSKADKMIRQREILLQIEARRDSVKRAKEDSIVKQKKLDYSKTHQFNHVPTDRKYLYCKYCEKMIDLSDTIICVGANNDSILWIDYLKGELGIEYSHIHKAWIPNSLKDDNRYAFHYTVFRDSLRSGFDNSPNRLIVLYNLKQYFNYIEKLQKTAPYGYVGQRSWNIKYRNLSVTMQYVNTNKKTIKYIEVFWQTKNAVGDIRNRGSFKGTGPVKYMESASWDWDNTTYYVAGDVTSFWVTKMVLTYTDGTKKVLTEKQIIYESSE